MTAIEDRVPVSTRALAIDDDPAQLNEVAAFSKGHGFEVSQAHNVSVAHGILWRM